MGLSAGVRLVAILVLSALVTLAATGPGPAAAAGWLQPVVLGESTFEGGRPAIAVADDGATTIAWDRLDDVRTRIVEVSSRRSHDGPWTAPLVLSRPGRPAYAPEVALGPNGTAIAVWWTYDGQRYRTEGASRDASGHWSAPFVLSLADAEGSRAGVAIAGDGTATVVWSGGADYVFQPVVASRSADGEWGDPVALSPLSTSDGNQPRVVAADGGVATVGWISGDGAMASSRSADGAWSAPTRLSEAGPGTQNMQLVRAGNGTVVAGWQRLTDGTGGVMQIQSASRTAAGAWGAATTLAPGGEQPVDLTLAAATDGGVSAAWSVSEGNGGRIQFTSRSSSGTWSAPVAISPSGEQSTGPQIALGRDGVAVAVWTRGDPNALRTARRGTDGRWRNLPVSLSSAASTYAAWPRVAMAADGVSTATWIANGPLPSQLDRLMVHVSMLDEVGPVLGDLVVPTTGTAGEPVAVSVAPRDRWAGPGRTSWSFGDGGTGDGDRATHTYEAAGTYTVTVTGRDEHDNETSDTRRITIAPGPTKLTPETPPTSEAPPTLGVTPAPGDGPLLHGTPVRPSAAASLALKSAKQPRGARSVALSAVVSAPGRIEAVATLTAPARKGHKGRATQVVYARLAATPVARAGKVRLVLRTTSAGRRSAGGRRFAVRVTVRYTTADGATIVRRATVRVGPSRA